MTRVIRQVAIGLIAALGLVITTGPNSYAGPAYAYKSGWVSAHSGLCNYYWYSQTTNNTPDLRNTQQYLASIPRMENNSSCQYWITVYYVDNNGVGRSKDSKLDTRFNTFYVALPTSSYRKITNVVYCWSDSYHHCGDGVKWVTP